MPRQGGFDRSGHGGQGGHGGRSSGGRGYYDEGPPENIIELGKFDHTCQEDIICMNICGKIPYFNAPVYFENKQQIGVVDEVFGTIMENGFSVKLVKDIRPTSFTEGQLVYISSNKLLSMDRFEAEAKGIPLQGRGRGRGSGRGSGRGGGDRGRGGRGRGGGSSWQGGDRRGFRGGNRGRPRGDSRGGFGGGYRDANREYGGGGRNRGDRSSGGRGDRGGHRSDWSNAPPPKRMRY